MVTKILHTSKTFSSSMARAEKIAIIKDKRALAVKSTKFNK